MKTVITILFWAALLTAFSIHGAKADKVNNTNQVNASQLAKPITQP